MKTTLVIVCLFLSFPIYAQLSVGQLESKWESIYAKGVQAYDNKNFDVAETEFLLSLNLLEKNGASNTLYHIYSLVKLGELYYVLHDSDKLSKITKQIQSIRKKIRTGSKSYINYLYNLGIYSSNIRDFDNAENYIREALSFEETLSAMDGMKCKLLHRLALCYYYRGKIDLAFLTEKECIETDCDNKPEYKKSLVYYCFQNMYWENLEKFIPECFISSREAVLRKFAHSKNVNRSISWSVDGLFFTHFLPIYAVKGKSELLNSYAYDGALFSKGILLNAENKSIELVLNSEDPQLLQTYSHYLDLKGKKSRTLEEDFEMQSLSDVFLNFQKTHKNEFRTDFRIGWKDIQQNLDNDDIAIEFITYPSEYNNLTQYAALCLKKDYSAPHLVEIGSLPSNLDDYLTSKLYDIIWGKLEHEIIDSQDIYFSPIGELCNIGIEYLPNDMGNNIFLEYNMYRLSSTKELTNKNKYKLDKTILFGGLNYDTETRELEQQNMNIVKQKTTFHNTDSIKIRSLNNNGGVSYLPGTLTEVENIKKILEDNCIYTELFTGNTGTETAFKKLNSSNIDILHLATHGFYYANKKLRTNGNLKKIYDDTNLIFIADNIVVINEDKMLTRSGLLLSGANNVLRNVMLPNNLDDGILYADEISRLNLSDVDLLVLSACQSGMGDIIASEGVFGLQRGFKLSGVKSIIMSLWEVEDAATEILMTEFYKNLTTGQNLRESLMNAQLHLRTINDGIYDNPQYWAAFILLDGIM